MKCTRMLILAYLYLISICFTAVLQLEIGSAPNTSKVIGNILQVMAPKEKTAVFLKSIKDTPFQETNGEK